MIATLVEEIREGERDFFRGQALVVSGAVFSPDGATLAYAVQGISESPSAHSHEPGMQQRHFTIKLREMTDWLPLDSPMPRQATRLPQPAPGGLLSFAPNGERLASVSGRALDLWRMDDQRLLFTWNHIFRLNGAAFSPSGQRLACAVAGPRFAARFGGCQVIVRGLQDGSTRRLIGHGAAVQATLFEDEDTVLSAGADGTIRRWRVDGAALGTFRGHRGPIDHVALALAPEGPIAASAGRDGAICLWRLPGGELLTTFSGHSGPARCVAFSPDGRLLASGSDDMTIRLWQVAERRSLGTLRGHNGAVNSVSFAPLPPRSYPDALLLASSAADHSIRLWRIT